MRFGPSLRHFIEWRCKTTPQEIGLHEFYANAWHSWTWEELNSHSIQIAKFLKHLGVQKGDRVVQISENRLEWILLDFALTRIGAWHVPLHSHSTSIQIEQILGHCQPAAVFTSCREQFEKLPTNWQEKSSTYYLVREPATNSLSNSSKLDTHQVDLLNLEQVHSAISSVSEADLTSDDVATVLYTSGTTGNPKGVMLSHRNILRNVEMKLSALTLNSNDVRLGILPFSHIFARTCDLYTWIAAGCTFVIGRGREQFFEDLQRWQPTYLNGVPYFYDKCYRELARENLLDSSDALHDLLGSKMRLCNCGGAPIPNEIWNWFLKHGVRLVTGYGLTETAPVLTSNTDTEVRIGTVGKLLPGIEMKLADDGELLVRGDNVMVGYYRDEVATSQVFDDGWFKTGDIVSVDDDGFISIIGRKKEMIVTLGGKKISPLALESALIQIPKVLQACVIGEGRNHIVALLTMNLNDPTFPPNSSPAVNAIFDGPIWDEVSRFLPKLLESFPSYERIRNFAILPRPFDIHQGEVTAKQSLRRSIIEKNYSKIIDELYSKLADGRLSKST